MKSRISDPLGGSSPDAGTRAKARFHLSGALMLGVVAVTLAAVLTARRSGSLRPPLAAECAAVFAAVATILAVRRSAPDAMPRLSCPMGTVATSVAWASPSRSASPRSSTCCRCCSPATSSPRAEIAANFLFAALCRARWRSR